MTMLFNKLSAWAKAFFGANDMTADQRVTYAELMRLDDAQLEDIGLTAGTMNAVVRQGPAPVRAIFPDGAVQA